MGQGKRYGGTGKCKNISGSSWQCIKETCIRGCQNVRRLHWQKWTSLYHCKSNIYNHYCFDPVYGDSNGYFSFFDIKMPYLTLIVLSLIATIGFDMIKVGIMTMMTKAFGGSAAPKAMYSVVGVQAVFDLLITAVICVLMIISPSIATVVAFTLGLVYAIGLTPFVGYASYTAVTNMDKDKRVYAFWIIIILLVIVALVICLLVGVGVVEKIESIVNSSYDSYSNSLDSLFNMFS